MNRKELGILINHIFDSLETNNLDVLGEPNKKMWQQPILGIAMGNDSYYDFLKNHIGEFHWNPKEVFELKYEKGIAENLRVVSMIFPQKEETKELQRRAKELPCDNWLVSRGKWEMMMNEFSGKLVKELEELGVRSVSIDLQPEFKREVSKDLGIASLWSHRHSAYAAGLGTFGLSDGFISEKGKAIRITSLIIEADFEPNDRENRKPYDWCLFFKDGSCGACMGRCPAKAIKGEGHDKEVCSKYVNEHVAANTPNYIDCSNYIMSCGLCQCKVPCESKRP